jgi:uncharacterized protein (DUF362 family)/ferredoxin
VRGRSTVVLLSCPDYDAARVERAVRQGLDMLGAELVARECAASGRPLLLKPNMLRPSPPERGVTTNPVVFQAVAGYFKDTGAPVCFGDSPNGVYSQEAAARQSGILAAAESVGVPMASFDAGEDVAWPHGVQNRLFHVARSVMGAGALVNLPKLKTHNLTRITGALKNIFGVIPGSLKAQFHVRHSDTQGFSRMIADLNGLVRSRLVVMDAVTAMEGNGPASGDLVHLGLLLFSDDPVAADAVACRIVGVDPMSVAPVRFAEEAGVGNARAEGIELRGEDTSAFRPSSFEIPAGAVMDRVPRFVFRIARDLCVPKPVIDPELCIKCGECVTACPTEPKSLGRSWQRAAAAEDRLVPGYDYGTCIRCYCCQETCARGAISVSRAPLARFFSERTS